MPFTSATLGLPGQACRVPKQTLGSTTKIFMKLISSLVFILLLVSQIEAAVMGIDFGQEWFKVSLVKPGVPLDIVLNKESKRKTRSIVAIREGQRVFDSEAVNVVSFL
jgi:hypoxia up-regulated 1